MGEGPIAHPHQPLDSGAQGPGARPKALSCRHPHLGWFSVGVRRLEEARATGLTCRGTHSHLLTPSSLRSPGGRGFEVVCRRRFVVCVMVGSRCIVVSAGTVVGGRVSPWRRHPVGHRSHIDPCMLGWFDVGRLAFCLFIVVPLSPQLFGWCLGVPAALWSACSSLRLFCCCWHCRVLGCGVDDVCAVGMVASGLGGVCCRQPMGRRSRFDPACLAAWVLVCSEGFSGRSVRCGECVANGACPVRRVGSPVLLRLWSACLGLYGGPYGPGGPCS